MKITLYNIKGWAGKTPIATNIVLDREYALATNEPYNILSTFIPEDRLLNVELEVPFPSIPDHIDIVFDLAWSISKKSLSIPSAIEQSDVVIVPIYNELKCLSAGLNTIIEVANFNKNIIVVATKLIKQKGDHSPDWKQCQDFKNIERMIQSKIDFKIPILPLKLSKAFDLIFEHETSIEWLQKANPLAHYTYREVRNQFDDLYFLIDTYAK